MAGTIKKTQFAKLCREDIEKDNVLKNLKIEDKLKESGGMALEDLYLIDETMLTYNISIVSFISF